MAKILRKRRAKLNNRRTAHSKTLASLPSSVKPEAFRQPGSMNRKKG